MLFDYCYTHWLVERCWLIGCLIAIIPRRFVDTRSICVRCASDDYLFVPCKFVSYQISLEFELLFFVLVFCTLSEHFFFGHRVCNVMFVWLMFFFRWISKTLMNCNQHKDHQIFKYFVCSNKSRMGGREKDRYKTSAWEKKITNYNSRANRKQQQRQTAKQKT